MNKQKTKRKNLEIRFNAGEDVLDYFDTSKAIRRKKLRKLATKTVAGVAD